MISEEQQKVTVMLPKRLVEEATRSVGLGITPTIRKGLEAIVATEALKRLRLRRGKIRFSLNVDEMRRDRA
ncbi:MAG: hypothetical protein K2X03_07870 [Bryobacteraceae bacterium]|nr:hypothetical protein [Bryobacteraceae bacterium]